MLTKEEIKKEAESIFGTKPYDFARIGAFELCGEWINKKYAKLKKQYESNLKITARLLKGKEKDNSDWQKKYDAILKLSLEFQAENKSLKKYRESHLRTIAELQMEKEELIDALRDLYDEQNDAPIERHRARWETAMEKAGRTLKKYENAKTLSDIG